MAKTAAEVRKQELEQEGAKQLISQAVKALGLTGCRFKIIESDGVEHGDLEVVKADPSVRTKKYNFQRDTGYIESVQRIADGQAITGMAVVPADHINNQEYIDNLFSVVKQKCQQLLGRDCFSAVVQRSHVDGRLMEVWVEFKRVLKEPVGAAS